MAKFQFKELVARAFFDYVGPPFPQWYKLNFKKFLLPDLQAINAKQLLGNKYFMTLELSYKGQKFQLPNEPLVSLGLTKTIIQTATVGTKRKGAVLEYITTENYAISIKGVCLDLSNPDNYPAAQVQTLVDLLNIDDSLEIVDSPFFELFGIRKLAISNIEYDEMVGEPGLQKYTITAISDQDFFADLNERQKLLG
jgi:hypothetical protein